MLLSSSAHGCTHLDVDKVCMKTAYLPSLHFPASLKKKSFSAVKTKPHEVQDSGGVRQFPVRLTYSLFLSRVGKDTGTSGLVLSGPWCSVLLHWSPLQISW